MLVKDFLKVCDSDVTFYVVDATKQGCMTYPKKCTILTNYKGIVFSEVGDKEVVHISPRGSMSLWLYIK